jgi:hypothetical protein
MSWFENKKWVWIWNSNNTVLIIQPNESRIAFKLLQYIVGHCSTLWCYSHTKGVTPSSMILVFIWFQEHRYQIGSFQGMTKWSWSNVKIDITMGVYLTHGPSGLDPRLSEPRGRPAARVGGGSAWALVAMCLPEQAKPESIEKVGGDRSTRLTGHVGWPPASTWHKTDLSKSVEVPFTPINRTLPSITNHLLCYLLCFATSVTN